MSKLSQSAERRLYGNESGPADVAEGSTRADWLADLSGSKQSSESSSIEADAR